MTALIVRWAPDDCEAVLLASLLERAGATVISVAYVPREVPPRSMSGFHVFTRVPVAEGQSEEEAITAVDKWVKEHRPAR